MTTLFTKQINFLNGKINCKSNLSSSQNLVDFFDLFFVCEVTARKLIEYYHAENNLTAKTETEKYNMTSLKAAVKHFSLSINEPTLQNIFRAGVGKRNQKSCRQLRNAYIHSLLDDDKAEIENRFNQLKTDMDTWINLF